MQSIDFITWFSERFGWSRCKHGANIWNGDFFFLVEEKKKAKKKRNEVKAKTIIIIIAI